MNPSKCFKNAILRLFRDGIYTVDYAIIQAEAIRNRGHLTKADYEELLEYLMQKQAELMAVEEANENEQIESVEEPLFEETEDNENEEVI